MTVNPLESLRCTSAGFEHKNDSRSDEVLVDAISRIRLFSSERPLESDSRGVFEMLLIRLTDSSQRDRLLEIGNVRGVDAIPQVFPLHLG